MDWMVSCYHMTVGSWDRTLSCSGRGGGSMPWVKSDKAWSWSLTRMWSQTEEAKFSFRSIPPLESNLMSAKKNVSFFFGGGGGKLPTVLNSFIYSVSEIGSFLLHMCTFLMSWASRIELVSIHDDWKRCCNPLLYMSNTVSEKRKRKNYQMKYTLVTRKRNTYFIKGMVTVNHTSWVRKKWEKWEGDKFKIPNCKGRQQWSIWSRGRREYHETTRKSWASLIHPFCSLLTSSQTSRIKMEDIYWKSLKKLKTMKNVQINSHVYVAHYSQK